MAITLSQKYLRELKKGFNSPNAVVEIALDSGTVRFGFIGQPSTITRFLADGACTADSATFACGSDELPGVSPVLKSISSLQNRLDVRGGYSTRGQLTAVITGRENFKGLLKNEYLKNRRAVRKDGFVSPGFTYLDYASTFSGKVLDWSRKGDELTIVIADHLKDASEKIPVEAQSNTSYLDYRDRNPADIISDILINQLGIDPDYVNVAGLERERDMWLSGWRFDRVLTEPREANQYLNELQVESNSFLVHDGDRINYKVFAPPLPWEPVEEWSDDVILMDSFSVRGGYKENFCNRVVVYYDYDESGNDRDENYEGAVIAVDAASQDPLQWDETSTRIVRSKWIRSRTYAYAGLITGLKVYHVSRANGTGSGTLIYNRSANTLAWKAPGGTAGEAVTISQDWKYQVFDSDKRKFIRVIVTADGLPGSDISETVDIKPLGGESYASALASKILSRYRDPAASVAFDIDLNNIADGSRFIKPTDLKDITTDEACSKGKDSWFRNRLMLTSVRPDFSSHKVSIEAVETKMHRRYGFIAQAGFPDYPSASDSQKAYGFIGDGADRLDSGSEDGFYIW